MSHDDENERPDYSGPYVVCIYLIDQAYGGPEEGGWWYTYGDPVLTTHVRVFAVRRDAEKYVLSLMPIVDEMNEGRPKITETNSIGRFGIHICEGWPKPFPDKIPRYS